MRLRPLSLCKQTMVSLHVLLLCSFPACITCQVPLRGTSDIHPGAAGGLAYQRDRLRLQRAIASLSANAPPAERAEALAAAKDAVVALVRSAPDAKTLTLILFGAAELLDAAPPLFDAAEVRRLMDAVSGGAEDGVEAQAVRLALARGLTRAHVAALCPA